MLIKNLREWFLETRRDLPWRQTLDPYAIWISEIMLQQTQVSVVIPYFERWMRAFPTVEKLSLSHLDDVIKIWEGLGYYSRARNIHEASKYIVKEHQGKLPNTEEELKKIKGIGPYTVGAILSFAFHQKKAAVDGNVIRVLTRLFNISEDISKQKTVKAIWDIAETVLPDHEPWIISEALIELGATVCTKNPKCQKCPLKSSCKAFLHGTEKELPIKLKKMTCTPLFRNVAVVTAKNKWLVKRGKSDKIMSDLYEFPYIETIKPEENLAKAQEKCLGISLKKIKDLKEVNHSFTRFRAKLNPSLFIAKETKPIQDHEWLTFEELERFAFSSGHRRILLQVRSETAVTAY